MPVLFDLVEPSVLEQQPPRKLPTPFLLNLIGAYLLEQPIRTYLDPLVLGTVLAALVLASLGQVLLAGLVLSLMLTGRLYGPLIQLSRSVREDYLLLHDGLSVTGYVLGLRDDETGTYLDCAIPIAPRYTVIGSVWMADAKQAHELGSSGQLAVICLPHAPGTWRLRDHDHPGVRYEPTSAVKQN